MTSKTPILLWFRRDLRTVDHPALTAAVASGRPIIPVFILDAGVEDLGAAPKWRLGLSVEALMARLALLGSKLILRRGDAQDVIESLISETGAGAVYWTRAYDPHAIARDTKVKTSLKARGIEAESFAGHLLFEPWTVQTKMGGYYRVYTPMWNTVKNRDVPDCLPSPARVAAPENWPNSDSLTDWHLGAAMRRGAPIVLPYLKIGEEAAQDRLHMFMDDSVARYRDRRDLPAIDGTSRLSENLAVGEISPRQCWHEGQRALHEGKVGAETFLKEIVWREFAYHLMFHTPHMLTENWKPGWDAFPWQGDNPHAVAWQQGCTGIPFVDAAMRELYVTGTMHNRGRMIVASYLTKHLMTHWKVGLKWFEDCLVDWDPASNAMGWQWAAGSGPDAAPYFRVFNPITQLEKFDKPGAYAARWIAEGQEAPSETALSFFDAIPRSWGLSATDRYPRAVVSAEDGRKKALEAYGNRGF